MSKKLLQHVGGYLTNVYFLSTFAYAFKPNLVDKGRYKTNLWDSSGQHIVLLRDAVNALLADPGTFIIKLAGKNNVLAQHRQILAGVVDAMVILLHYMFYICVGAKRIVLVSEGDNLEMALDNPDRAYTPFAHAQLKFIQYCTQHRTEIHFLIIKTTPPENGFSAGFVDGWMEGLKGVIDPSKVYFGLVATGNDELTFNMAHLVPFIGTTMCENYMYKIGDVDDNGAKVPTTGFKHVLQLEENPEFTRLSGAATVAEFTRFSESTEELITPQETFIMFINSALHKRFPKVNPVTWSLAPWMLARAVRTS